MKTEDLTPGVEYMTYHGADPANAYLARRVRLLSLTGFDMSSGINPKGLDIEIDGQTVHVPGAKRPKRTGTHLLFEEIHPTTGQATGKIALTPAQVKFSWDEGLAAVRQARDEAKAQRDSRAALVDDQRAAASSVSGRIAALLPDASATVTTSVQDVRTLTVDIDTLNSLLDLAQRAKFGPV